MAQHRIFSIPFAKVYPLYVQKAERKERTKEEVDQIICWLTGYDQAGLDENAHGRARLNDQGASLLARCLTLLSGPASDGQAPTATT